MSLKPYRDVQAATRRFYNRITAKTLQSNIRALEDWIDTLTNPSSLRRRQAYDLERIQALQAARDELTDRLERNIDAGIALTSRDVQEAWINARDQFDAALVKKGAASGLGGGFEMAAAFRQRAYQGLGAQSFKTVLRGYISNADQEVNSIINRALQEKMTPKELAKALRRYVIASEEIQKAFPGASRAMLDDFRKIPKAYRGAAKLIRYQAERIAYTEIQNAKRQSEINAWQLDPYVKAVKWTRTNTAPLRACNCDTLARNDFWGLGPGVYPVANVPFLPHPFCACKRVPIVTDNPRTPKPRGTFNYNPQNITIPDYTYPLTPAAKAKLRQSARQLL